MTFTHQFKIKGHTVQYVRTSVGYICRVLIVPDDFEPDADHYYFTTDEVGDIEAVASIALDIRQQEVDKWMRTSRKTLK